MATTRIKKGREEKEHKDKMLKRGVPSKGTEVDEEEGKMNFEVDKDFKHTFASYEKSKYLT